MYTSIIINCATEIARPTVQRCRVGQRAIAAAGHHYHDHPSPSLSTNIIGAPYNQECKLRVGHYGAQPDIILCKNFLFFFLYTIACLPFLSKTPDCNLTPLKPKDSLLIILLQLWREQCFLFLYIM